MRHRCQCTRKRTHNKVGRLCWSNGRVRVGTDTFFLLILGSCRGIIDVSSLGRVYDLDFNGCTGITDVSTLGNLHKLNMNRCAGVNDTAALKSVCFLILTKGEVDVLPG